MDYDLIIIGAGVTGFGAAMYAGRLGMKTAVIGEIVGGTIILTNLVENYPGFKRLTGQELADNLREHALEYREFVSVIEKKVSRIERLAGGFRVHTGDTSQTSKTVIYATGTVWRELKVPGHDEYKNRGVHYCALCDGFFYRGKTVAVVGGSDSAAKDALVLAEHAQKVYIIYRGEQIRPEPPNLRRVLAKRNIEIITNTNVTAIHGDARGVTSVTLDRAHAGKPELQVAGVFIAIGHIPLSQLAKDAGVETDAKGEIKIDRKCQTNVPGFFAAGDITDTHFKQAITGVAEGVTAAYSAYEHLGSR